MIKAVIFCSGNKKAVPAKCMKYFKSTAVIFHSGQFVALIPEINPVPQSVFFRSGGFPVMMEKNQFSVRAVRIHTHKSFARVNIICLIFFHMRKMTLSPHKIHMRCRQVGPYGTHMVDSGGNNLFQLLHFFPPY